MPQWEGLRNPVGLTKRPRGPKSLSWLEKNPRPMPARQRLAKALKANIAKRKAQARAQEEAGRPAEAPEAPPDEDGCPN